MLLAYRVHHITKNVCGYNFSFISGVPCVSSPNGVFELKFYFFMLNCMLYLTFHFGLNRVSNLSKCAMPGTTS